MYIYIYIYMYMHIHSFLKSWDIARSGLVGLFLSGYNYVCNRCGVNCKEFITPFISIHGEVRWGTALCR